MPVLQGCRSESAAAARPDCCRARATARGRFPGTGSWSPLSQLHHRFCARAAQPLMCRRDELAERPGLADNRRQLRPGRHEHPQFVTAEDARLHCLHDQHALKQSVFDDGNAQERVVRILASFPEILESWMHGRVRDDLRPELLGHQAGQALVEAHRTRPTLSGRRPMWPRAPGWSRWVRADRPNRRPS